MFTGILHTRGGEPGEKMSKVEIHLVFSTRVEVNRSLLDEIVICVRILHTRGGEPLEINKLVEDALYSPHAWR